MQRQPHEHERGLRVGRELTALGAVAVGEPHEAALVDAPEQHDTRVGMSVLVDCRERHRVRLFESSGGRVLVPTLELDHGVVREVGAFEALSLVVAAQRRDVLALRERLEHAGTHRLEVRTKCDEDLRCDSFALTDEPEEDVLGADVVVTECQRLAQ